MSSLRVLFIGGSGIISAACSRLAVRAGIDLYALNRAPQPAAATAGGGQRAARRCPRSSLSG